MDISALAIFAQEAAAEPAPPLELSLRLPFSILHFLEFAIWGAWFVVLGNYLNSLNFSRNAIGSIYATIPIGSVIAPMFVGSIADRYFATEHVLAISHLLGALCLLAMAFIKKPIPFFIVALLYALAYAPTLALVNSIVFANIVDIERDFPTIRVLGTIGWILAGLSLKLLIKSDQPVNNRPLLLAGVLSLILGVFCFFLPHTPPPSEPGDAIPFLRAFELLGESNFAIFFGVSFLITLALAFYYSFTALFLEQHAKVRPDNVGPMMTIGQWVEIIFMFTLPWFLDVLGMKWVLAVGMAAWGIRYGLFAIGRPMALLIIGIGLHGICFDFFFAAGFIYVEQAADPEISASAQSLFAVLTYGLGMWLGTEASGWLNRALTTETVDPATKEPVRVTNWRLFWIIPSIGVLVSFVLFVLLFSID